MADKGTIDRGNLTPETWLKLRKISQVVFLLLILGVFLWSRRVFYLNPAAGTGIQEKLINLPLKLDPLVSFIQMIASRRILPGLLLALVTLIITVLLGRVWCGWFCPVGSLLDWIPLRTWKKNRPGVPQGWRGVKYIILSVIFLAAILGNLTLLFLDPITIFYRTLTSAIWPALDSVVTGLEVILFRVEFLQPVVGGFDSIIRPTILPSYPATYRFGLLYFGFFLSLISLNLLAPRFWCRYLCPLGGLLGLLGKNSLVRCEINESCTICGSCFDICPTGAIQTHDKVFVDTGECTMCMACGADCPGGAVSYPAHFGRVISQPYDLDRRKAIISLGTAVIGVGILQSEAVQGREHPKMIRPPGVNLDRFLSTCIRCGECSTVCPTNAIQLAVTEAGIEGFWSPIIIPRLGYCDYSCHACGIVCPVEAIPPLSLEDKRKQVIGKAEIDRTRCLPWGEDQDCIVCEEMCPVPEKAIELQTTQIITADGEQKTIQRPYVIRRLCIGCGICETKCPLAGDAAIQIKAHAGAQKRNRYGVGGRDGRKGEISPGIR